MGKRRPSAPDKPSTPDKLAAAIGYSPEEPAPQLLASGRGREAERIIAIAQQAGVAVMEDAALAAMLDLWAGDPRTKPGNYIPYWCWEATAAILALVTKKR